MNRLFGNGLDDNNNGTIDEPLEWSVNQESYEMVPGIVTPNMSLRADPNHATNATNPVFARQQYARYLFCLAMLAMDRTFEIEGSTGRPETVRRIAQWAINVVDFRDPDAVMTPFEYDLATV